MIAPLTSGKCQLNGLVIALAVTLPILMSIVPHEASAKGGITSHLAPRAEAATLTSPRSGPPTEPLGAYRCACFSGNICFLGSYVAYAPSKDREFYKV